jgi:hypothetical protein
MTRKQEFIEQQFVRLEQKFAERNLFEHDAFGKIEREGVLGLMLNEVFELKYETVELRDLIFRAGLIHRRGG